MEKKNESSHPSETRGEKNRTKRRETHPPNLLLLPHSMHILFVASSSSSPSWCSLHDMGELNGLQLHQP